MRAQADRMLSALGVTRNRTDIVGQLAELIVSGSLHGTRVSAVQAGYDVMTPTGLRVEVKGRLADEGARRLTVLLRNLDRSPRPFDALVYVQFRPDYELEVGRMFDFELVRELAHRVRDGWRMDMSDDVLARGDDLTGDLGQTLKDLP